MPVLYSVVVPVHNEIGNAAELAREIDTVFKGHYAAGSYEIIFVDDCSRDDTLKSLIATKAEIPALRVLSHDRNSGQSRAVRTGVLAAGGGIILTMDGDGQNPPADGPKLIDALAASGPDVVMAAGQRLKRQDSAAKKWASKWANRY
jgi:dolichol-phosphate mannosyltransferase